MSELITQTARLVPYLKRPKQVPSYVTAYAYEPMADEPGAALGNMYVIMEVLISGRASVEVADIIIETLGENYYNNPETSLSPVERFEAAIKSVNHGLSELVNRGNAAWIGKLSAVIAIQVESELHVAQTGSAEAFLYRGKAGARINAGTVSRPTTPNKTFGALATGQLEPGDRFLLATPALIHQVPLNRLQSIISQSVPSTAIAEITELLKGASVDRIGAIVVEITTPELAALQLRSEQPNEIQLGVPENAIEAAKMAATPIAASTVTSTKRVAGAAQSAWASAKPKAQNMGLRAAAALRQVLGSRKGRMVLLGTTVTCIIVVALIVIANNISSQNDRYFTQFQSAYNKLQAADSSTDNNSALSDLAQASSMLTVLKPHTSVVNAKLKITTLPENEPRTYAELVSLISQKQDTLNGLTQVSTTTVTSFGSGYGTVDRFEVYNGHAYAFGEGKASSLSIVNLSTNAVAASSADTSQLGAITGTTLSYDHTGIFITTSTPAVWFYRFATDTLVRQTNYVGSWPKATAIASYGSNIYLLSGPNVYKYTKSGSTYGRPSTSESAVGNGSALAIDGSIYVIADGKLDQYLSGSLAHSETLPALAANVENLRSFQSGAFLLGSSAPTARIVEWSVDTNGLAVKHIFGLNLSKLTDASYDPSTGAIYALANNQLLKISSQP
jgi:hypothetical protein